VKRFYKKITEDDFLKVISTAGNRKDDFSVLNNYPYTKLLNVSTQQWFLLLLGGVCVYVSSLFF